MSVTLTSLNAKIRALIDDNLLSDSDIHTYANSDVFTISEENVSEVSALYVNDVDYGDANWTYSAGKVTLDTSSGISTGDTIEITYTYYPNYSATQIDNYTRAALIHISVNNYTDFIVESGDVINPEPDDAEKNLISLVTSILIEPQNRTVRMPDFTIAVPNDLPTDKKISRTIALFKKNSHGIFDIA